MPSFFFKGKNWKLASEKKWVEEDVDRASLTNRVGQVSIGGVDYDVFPMEGGFAAVESREPIQEPVQKVRWIVNAAGGNVNRQVSARDESEARKKLEQICEVFQTVGILYLVKEDGTSEKICAFSASKKVS